MRGYHIRIALQLPSSNLQPSDSFTPSRLFQPLPPHKPKPTVRKNALFNPNHKDYRFGPIRLDWTDFEDMSKAPYSTVVKEREPRHGAPSPLLVCLS